MNALSITEEQLNVQSFITKQLDSMRVSRYTLITRWHAVWVIVIGGRLFNMLSDCVSRSRHFYDNDDDEDEEDDDDAMMMKMMIRKIMMGENEMKTKLDKMNLLSNYS